MLKIIDISDIYIEQVVDVHLQAFKGYLNTKLGTWYVKRFICWFASNDKAIAVCAIYMDEVVGYIVGAPTGYSSELTRYIFWSALCGAITRFWVFFDPKYLRVLLARAGVYHYRPNQIPDLPAPTMSLVGIGVRPDARGKNVGKLLMQTFEQQAQSKGAKSLRLSVYPENLNAQKLYERMGWQKHSLETPSGAIYYYKLITAK
ncbi:MAG: GNAT family N-acetyltransferase [Chloroflexota bacterium]